MVSTPQVIAIIAFSLGIAAFLLPWRRRANAKAKRPGWHDRYEPGWTQTYAAADGLIYAHEALGSLARPSREQLVDLASVGMGEWDEARGGIILGQPAPRLRDW